MQIGLKLNSKMGKLLHLLPVDVVITITTTTTTTTNCFTSDSPEIPDWRKTHIIMPNKTLCVCVCAEFEHLRAPWFDPCTNEEQNKVDSGRILVFLPHYAGLVNESPSQCVLFLQNGNTHGRDSPVLFLRFGSLSTAFK